MRTLIISDVHANLTALNAVLADAGVFERVWCLGDIVGYGPDPNQCIERIANLPGLQCVKGNHDAAIVGEIPVAAFNAEARASLRWLENQLSPENKAWLANLPERLILDRVTLVHGSPRNPVWEYIMDLRTARENMREFETHICLIGHTHLPVVFQMEGDTPQTTRQRFLEEGVAVILEHRSILNPGSVGQPRDWDPRSAYLIFDDAADSYTLHRVTYDVNSVQERIRTAGLPGRHADRLAEGW